MKKTTKNREKNKKNIALIGHMGSGQISNRKLIAKN